MGPIRSALAVAASDKGSKVRPQERKAPAVDAAPIVAAEQRGFERGLETGGNIAQNFAITALRTARSLLDKEIAELDEMQRANPAPDRPKEITRKISNGGSNPAPRPPKEISGDASAGARKMLGVIDVKPARSFTWTQIAMLAGYSEYGGAFRRGKKWLVEQGTVIESGGEVRIRTPSASAKAPATGDDLVNIWIGKLPPAGAAVMKMLWDDEAFHTEAARVEMIASALGYQTSGGAWRRGVKALRDAGIVSVNSGMIQFTPGFMGIAKQ